jgi:uncharacterized protein YrrD
MLWRASELGGYQISAVDGSIGSVSDLLVDCHDWTVRWLVVDTGKWLPGRKVLLPPDVAGPPDAAWRGLPVELTRERVAQSPPLEPDSPISRQRESEVYGHYGWAPYWQPTYVPPIAPLAVDVPPVRADVRGSGHEEPAAEPGDPDLRSASELTGFHVRATDDDIGRVAELLIEDGSWVVRYLVVETGNWWSGKKVLVSPQWIRDVSWTDRQVRVDLTRTQVRNGPEYDASAVVDRDYEERLYGYYGHDPYWNR